MNSKKIFTHAVKILEDCRNPLDGEINLTLLEENIVNDLDISWSVWENSDMSFDLYTYLASKGLL